MIRYALLFFMNHFPHDDDLLRDGHSFFVHSFVLHCLFILPFCIRPQASDASLNPDGSWSSVRVDQIPASSYYQSRLNPEMDITMVGNVLY